MAAAFFAYLAAEEQLAVLLSSCSSSNDNALPHDTSGNSSSSSSSRLLGWFSYRPHTPSIPSMLEAAVCQKLQAILSSSDELNNSSSSSSAPQQQQQQQQQPLVFGLITSQAEHSGATISLQHRFFAFHQDNTWQYSLEQYRPSSTFSSFGGGTGGTKVKAVQHPNLQPLELQVLNLGQAGMQQSVGAAAAAGAGAGAGGGGGVGGGGEGVGAGSG